MDIFDELRKAQGSKEERAIFALSSNFRKIDPSFHFESFLASIKPRKKFLALLLYTLYYDDWDFTLNLEFLLLQLAAEICPVKKIVENFPREKQLELICFLFKHYREGSYPLLKILERLHPKLVINLRRNYFALSKFEENLHASDLVALLEEDAQNRTRVFQKTFQEVLDLMIASPVSVYDHLEKMKQPCLPNPEEREKAVTKSALLKKELSHSYKERDFLKFTRIYGLDGFYPFFPLRDMVFKQTGLVEKLEILKEIFTNPPLFLLAPTTVKEINLFFSFAKALLKMIPLTKSEKWTFGMPTKGKDLSLLPSLPSLLKSLKALKAPMEKTPLYIFDQSAPPLFQKNKLFIDKLNKRYKSSIFHISEEQAIIVAKKLSIEKLLITTPSGSFGFGGMRNGVLLLTPVFRHAEKNAWEMDAKSLRKLFEQHVLSASADTIFMIDDDIELSEANILAYYLFNEEHKNLYSSREGSCLGRETKRIVYPFLELLLNDPKKMDTFPKWSDVPIRAGMSDIATKPFACLNLPFGNEETHFCIPYYQNAIEKPSYHLSGARFPLKTIPTDFYVGLEEPLKKYLPYCFQICMMNALLDPANLHQRLVLHWNRKKYRNTFTSLEGVISIISEQTSKMQQQFWKNVKVFFLSKTPNKFREIIKKIKSEDIEALTQNKSLAALYKYQQQDVHYFWEYGERMAKSDITLIDRVKEEIEKKHNIRFSDYPCTEGLWLLFHSIGAAEYNHLVTDALK